MALITKLAKNLEYKNGIWFSERNVSISYPEDHHDMCFEVEEVSFWFKHRNKCIIQIIQNFPPLANIIIEVGAGNGFVSNAMKKELNIKTVMIEPDLAGILNARKRGLKNLICAPFQDIDFYDNSIPNVGLFDVLEHIQQDYDFISMIKTKLIPNGRVYITVPAHNFLWSDFDSGAGHFRRYSLSSIKKLLTKTGFSVVYGTYFFSFLLAPIFLRRTLPYRLNFIKKYNLEKMKSEHSIKNPFINKILRKLSHAEALTITKKIMIPLGTSCFIVAQK